MESIVHYICAAVLFLLRIFLTLKNGNQRKSVPPITDPILLTSATALAAKIREGKLHSVEVVKSYIERIKEVQPYVNGLAEDRFEKALKEAKEADSFVFSGQMTVEEMAEKKPLLGVPCTVKIMTAVEGMGWNASCLLFKGKKAESDAEIVSLMKSKGVIVIGVTVMPEIAMNLIGESKLYGAVKNPYDSRVYVGISSSGEVALNASAAVPFGLGNDLLGSLRFPSYFCGVFCHRPTTGMLSNQGTLPVTSERTGRILTHGPISRYSEDLTLFMKAVLGTKAKEMKIGEPVDFSKITIYYTHSFPKHSFAPEVDTETLWTIQKVINYFKENYGTKVKYVQMKEMTDAAKIISMHTKMGFENSLGRFLKASGEFVSAKKELIKSLFGKSKFYTTTLYMYEHVQKTNNNFRTYPKARSLKETMEEQLNGMLDGNSILLFPTFPLKWVYTPEIYFSSFGVLFCSIFSIFQLPVTQCPTGLCKEGLPLGLQVIANKYQDNLTLAVASEIEKAFGGWIPPSAV